MAFTDAQLENLEDFLRWPKDVGVKPKLVRELVDRLIAAERIAKFVEKHGDGSLWLECESWKKACGR